MTTWPIRTLGELVENLDFARVPIKEAERRPGPYPYYGASGIVDHVDGYIFDGDYILVAEDGENLRTQQTPIAFMARGKFWVNNHAHILRGSNGNVSGYLMYAIRAADVRSFLTGSTMPKLTQANLNRIPIPAPPRATQLAITRILGTLDDKIELNRQMNETLEAMAQALFKSWFVDFDPVRARAEGRKPGAIDAQTAYLFPNEFENSALGQTPKGWHRTCLGDAIEIHDSKRIPLSAREREQRKGHYPYYGAASLMDHVNDYLFDGVYVLLGEDGSVVHDDGMPFVQYVWGKFWVNNHAHVLRGKNGVCAEHLALFLRQCDIRPFVTGAVQPKLNQANLCRIPFTLATQRVCEAFGTTVGPLFTLFRANMEQIATLADLRDALLPRLLSGELPIRHAERLAEAAL